MMTGFSGRMGKKPKIIIANKIISWKLETINLPGNVQVKVHYCSSAFENIVNTKVFAIKHQLSEEHSEFWANIFAN